MELSKRTETGGRNKPINRIRLSVLLILLVAICIQVLSACSFSPKKQALKVLIIPKFEIGQMSGDFPGEAQLFYEEYCPGCGEIEIPHMPPTAHFYFNDKNGVGVLVTDSGKTAAGLSLTARTHTLPSNVSLRHVTMDMPPRNPSARSSNTPVMWFPDDSFADYEYKSLNADLCEKTFEMIRDCPLQNALICWTGSFHCASS